MIKMIAIGSIRFYQKHLSHRKGYKCAHGVLHQNGTCSSIILNIVKTEPLTKWYSLIRGQFNNCKVALKTIEEQKEKDNKKRREGKKECLGDAACESLDCMPSACSNTRSLKKCDDCSPDLGDCGDCDIGSC